MRWASGCVRCVKQHATTRAAAAAASPLAAGPRVCAPTATARRQSAAAAAAPNNNKDLVRSIRAMPIKLIRVSKDNSPAAAACAGEWVAKLGHYTAVSEVVIKPNPRGASSPTVQKEAEAEKVLKAVGAGDRLILLDERGRDASSEDMARLLIRASDDGTPLCFAVGGSYGHGEAVRARADESVRLSRMVLNHSVAYIVLVEQLYRAWTLVKGTPYHH